MNLRKWFGLIQCVFVTTAFAQHLTISHLFQDHAVLQRDKPIRVWGTGVPGKSVSLKFDGRTAEAVIDADGNWLINLERHRAGGPFAMSIRSNGDLIEVKDLLLGDVWVASGQSNMHFLMRPALPWTEGVLNYEQEIANASNNNIRFFIEPVEASYPQKKDVDGTWMAVSPDVACNLSAVAWYFARTIQAKVGIPIGIISASVDATNISSWMDSSHQKTETLSLEKQVREKYATEINAFQQLLPAYYKASNHAVHVCATVPEAQLKWPMHEFLYQSTGCYNAMIAPLGRFPVRGVIWYQGEGDAPIAQGYAERMRSLVEDWRRLWGDPKLPFYYVQLANRDFRAAQAGKPNAHEGNYANLRGEQFKALQISNVGMAVATDIGDSMLTHPRDKKTVGERLALQALHKTYNLPVVADGPIFSSIEIKDSTVIVTFELSGSKLVNKTGSSSPGGFEIADRNGKFVPAMTKLIGNQVEVSSPVVKTPTQVRYGWADDPKLSLYNTEGIPGPSFSSERKNNGSSSASQTEGTEEAWQSQ